MIIKKLLVYYKKSDEKIREDEKYERIIKSNKSKNRNNILI